MEIINDCQKCFSDERPPVGTAADGRQMCARCLDLPIWCRSCGAVLGPEARLLCSSCCPKPIGQFVVFVDFAEGWAFVEENPSTYSKGHYMACGYYPYYGTGGREGARREAEHHARLFQQGRNNSPHTPYSTPTTCSV
jgi:hypothetical protein